MELHAEFEEPVWRKKVSEELTKYPQALLLH